MKLSPAFLAYKLSSAFSVLAPENLPLSGTLELPVLYQTGSAATAHRVFLCTEEQIGSLSSLPEESSSLFLLCTEELPEELPAPVSIAVKSSVSAVFSFLQELFWTYDSWQKELMQARLDGKSIQHLLNLSLPVFAHHQLGDAVGGQGVVQVEKGLILVVHKYPPLRFLSPA